MTRLKEIDIADISTNLIRYDSHLRKQTGQTLAAIGARCCGIDEADLKEKAGDFTIQVIPITAGMGIIGGFCWTVCTILQFLGFPAEVTSTTDAAGIADAYAGGKDGIFLADDHRFISINLSTRCVADNSRLTGGAYATALDGMAAGLVGREVLLIGCGPVGEAAAAKLLDLGAKVYLYDKDLAAARMVQSSLADERVHLLDRLPTEPDFLYILEATPSANSIPDCILSSNTKVAAAGVPLGISRRGCSILGDSLVHDKLELGVAAMAASLLVPSEQGDSDD